MSYTRWNALRATDGLSWTMSRYSQNVPSQCCSRKWDVSRRRSISETSGLVLGVVGIGVRSHSHTTPELRGVIHSLDTVAVMWMGGRRASLLNRRRFNARAFPRCAGGQHLQAPRRVARGKPAPMGDFVGGTS